MATVQVLVVGGGGGGGYAAGPGQGGGGAGGVVYNAAYSISVQAYSVTVGNGGAVNSSGTSSVFGSITAYGGGAGGASTAWNAGVAGGNGASGGGGGGEYSVARGGGSATQGYAGGTANVFGYGSYKGAGGGGAGGVGGNSNNRSSTATNYGGSGGIGIQYSISGTATYYGGGGGGNVYIENNYGYDAARGTGGKGGGGHGEKYNNSTGLLATATNGTANTGGGGGGAINGTGTSGASGGSGIVIIRYTTGSISATGGTITTIGGDTVHTFTSSGTFTVTDAPSTTSNDVALKLRPISQTRFINDPNLVAYWPLDGNSNDIKGGLNGIDTSVNYVTGLFNQCGSFNGSNSQVDCTNNITLQNNSLTISAWIKTGAAGSGVRGVVVKQGTWGIFLYDNVLQIYDWSAGTFRVSSANLASNTWRHIVMSVQNGVSNGTFLYVDGILSLTTTITYSNQNVSVRIGSGGDGNTQYFTGLIDDVAIFNRILTREEVQEIYQGFVQQESLPNIRPIGGISSTSLINDANLVSYWKLDGNSRDSKGSNHGTDTAVTYNSSSGKFGQGGIFNGSNSKITTPTISLGSTFSVSFWAKFTTTAMGFILGEAAPSGTFYSWCVYVSGGNLQFLSKGTTEQTGVGVSAVNDGQWHHFVGVYVNNSSVTGYCDGVLIGTTPMTTTFTYRAFTIGYGDDTFWGAFNGNIEDIALFNRSLSVAEVFDIYSAGVTSTIRPLDAHSLRNDANLLAYWKLNGDVIDSKGSLNGTASNVSYLTGVSGTFNKGALFNGSSSYISLAQNSMFNTAFTLSVWFKTSSSGAIFGCQNNTIGNTPTEYNPIIYVGTDYKVRGGIYNGAAAPPLSSTIATYNDNKWHNAVVVGNPATSLQYLYVDGIFVMSATRGGTSTLYNNIGAAYTGGAWAAAPSTWSYFNGTIDDISIFNRALTPAEIWQIYTQGTVSAYWKLNGNSVDSSGNGIHGTDTGVSYGMGRAGQCAVFSGSSSYVSIGTGLPVVNTAISVGAWVKTTQAQGSAKGILAKMGTGAPYYGMLLRMWNVGAAAEFGVSSTGSNYTNVVGTTPINDGYWHYIVGVFAPSQFLKIYVDGRCQNTVTSGVPSSIYNTSGGGVIGASYTNGNEGFVGSIEEVTVETRIRTDSEIAKYYTSRGGKGYRYDIPSSGLLVHLDASNSASYPGSGTTWYDISGNGKNATMYNSPTFSSNNGGIIQTNGSSYAEIPSASLNLSSTNYTVICASRYSGSTNGRIVTGVANNWLLGHHGNSVLEYYAEGWIQDTSTTDTAWRIYAGTGNISGDVYGLYVNGTLAASNNGGSQGPNGLTVAGGHIYSEMSVSEVGFILVYNRVLSADEIANIYNLKKIRFGLT